jgi:HPt (histidine-containing phosphotransfer) domain-containing protein
MSGLKITDLSYLQEVSGGEPRFMKKMMRVFSEQVPEFIENMEKHLADKDYISLGREAHKAKSSVGIVGMNDLGTKMKELQLLTEKSENIESYAGYIEEFKSLCLAAVVELEEYSDQLK